jgi:hypothetical protein
LICGRLYFESSKARFDPYQSHRLWVNYDGVMNIADFKHYR